MIDLAEAVDWEGDALAFVDGLRSAGVICPDGTLCQWPETGGRISRERDGSRQRKQRERERRNELVTRNSTVTDADGAATEPGRPPASRPRSDQTRSDQTRSANAGDAAVAADAATGERLSSEQMEQAWAAYPKRNGRKLGKHQAVAQLKKLKATDFRLLMLAIAEYERMREGPADMFRWLRDGRWREIAEQAHEDRGWHGGLLVARETMPAQRSGIGAERDLRAALRLMREPDRGNPDAIAAALIAAGGSR